MSYEIVKGLNVSENQNRIFITSASNNIYPKTYSRFAFRDNIDYYKREIEKLGKLIEQGINLEENKDRLLKYEKGLLENEKYFKETPFKMQLLEFYKSMDEGNFQPIPSLKNPFIYASHEFRDYLDNLGHIDWRSNNQGYEERIKEDELIKKGLVDLTKVDISRLSFNNPLHKEVLEGYADKLYDIYKNKTYDQSTYLLYTKGEYDLTSIKNTKNGVRVGNMPLNSFLKQTLKNGLVKDKGFALESYDFIDLKRLKNKLPYINFSSGSKLNDPNNLVAIDVSNLEGIELYQKVLTSVSGENDKNRLDEIIKRGYGYFKDFKNESELMPFEEFKSLAIKYDKTLENKTKMRSEELVKVDDYYGLQIDSKEFSKIRNEVLESLFDEDEKIYKYSLNEISVRRSLIIQNEFLLEQQRNVTNKGKIFEDFIDRIRGVERKNLAEEENER